MRGGYGSSGHGSLQERIHGPTPTPPPSPARHCLVDGAPSLLVEWRQRERAWEGRVISVLWFDGQGWASVERWLPASAITRPG